MSRDQAEAVRFFTIASDLKFAVAQHQLALYYDKGIVVPRDAAKAAQLYTLAADCGYLHAQFSLAVCFEEGNGVVTNTTKAEHYYRLAVGNGHALASFGLGKLLLDTAEGDATLERECSLSISRAASQMVSYG